MTLEQLLFSQGFGTRYDCRSLIAAGKVSINDTVIDDPDEEVDFEDGGTFCVDGVVWPYYEKAILVMNKPEHYECSAKPLAHPSVNSLLPAPLRKRNVQPIGRLDEDTTGLLLFTDDGKLNHVLTHPKKKVAKIYEVGLRHPVTQTFVDTLLTGVVLRDTNEKVQAADCEIVNDLMIRLTITQGKYHQVKRMVAAASNRVQSLRRIQFGKLVLPAELAPGEWKWIPSSSEIL